MAIQRTPFKYFKHKKQYKSQSLPLPRHTDKKIKMMFSSASLIIFLMLQNVQWCQTSKEPTDKRESETGLLTYNEAIQLARNTCNRVDGVTSILKNPLAKLFGLTSLVKGLELPLPRNALDPIGFFAWASRQGLRLQAHIRKIGKRKRDASFLTVDELLGLLDYPCQQLDFKQSFVDNEYISWLRLGNWTLPLVDYNAKRVNIWAVPRVWFKTVFGRRTVKFF
uniref:Uncharacterized protein n=1 Tax=Strigamia maritima TaxID=126957 RepID=T1JNE1_STRMM